jgi:acyl-coenzyme A thioesterase PaaI-like protein
MAENNADDGSPTGKPWSGGGREELASAVRRLMTSTVTSTAPAEMLVDIAGRAAALADALERYVPLPDPVPRARFADDLAQPGVAVTMAAAMPFDMIIGSCNPVAPPITIEFEPSRAVGRVTFGPSYEGAPGCVHGAALAGAFDIMLTAANFLANAAGPTVELTIRYRKPTLISQPAVFETWVNERVGRRIHSEGRLVQGGVVTVEAAGEFVDMERARIAQMHRRGGSPAPGDAEKGG